MCGREPIVTSCGGRGFVADSDATGRSIGYVGALDGCCNTVTARRDRMDSIPASHWAEIDYNGQVFRVFPQSLPVNDCVVSQSKPRSHNSTSYSVHYLVTLSSDAI